LYVIDYLEKDKFGITLQDEDFMDAQIFLEGYNLYYNEKFKSVVFSKKIILDVISIFEYDNVQYVLSEIALEKVKEFYATFKPEQKYFRNVKFDDSILHSDFKLKEYQKDCLKFTLSRSRSYIADDPGIGKTSESICTFSQWYKDGKVEKIFIVTRPGISYNWKTEILSVVNLFKEDDIIVIDNDNKKFIFDTYSDKKIIIVSNHLLKHVFLIYKDKKNFNKSAKLVRWKSYVDMQKKLKSDKLCIVIDEAHELTNSDAVSTRAILAHIHYFNYRICLSATPSGNRWEKYFNSFQFLDKGVLPFTETAFKIYLSNVRGDKYDKHAIVEYREDRVQELKRKVFDLYFIKRLKKDLPEMKYKQIIKPIYFEMSSVHKKLYQNFIQYNIDKIEMENEKINLKLIINKFPYLVLVIENPFMLKDRVTNDVVDKMVNSWKLENDNRFLLLKDLLKAYIENDGEKVIVFDNHPFSIDLLAKEFEKYNPLKLHGEMKYKEIDKKRIQDLYNDKNNEHRLLLMNPSVGGVGISLNKGGRHTIVYTAPDNAVLTEQLLARCDRINNTDNSINEFLLADYSLDIFRYNRIMGKIQLNENYLTKSLTREELKNLLQMSVNGGR